MVDIPVEISSAIGATPRQTFENVQKSVAKSLIYMQDQTEKLLEAYDWYCRSDDDRLKDELVESMANRLNHIVQAFCDVMVFIEINEKDSVFEESLGYHIRQCEARGIVQSQDEKSALKFLEKRNPIVHDYFNAAKLNHEMLTALASYGSGFVQMAKNLRTYCRNHFSMEELEEEVTRARKNASKLENESTVREQGARTERTPKRKR